MTLGQMRVAIKAAEEAIDHFAAGNDAFDRDRKKWRSNLSVESVELGVGLTALSFALRNDFYTVVVNAENEVVHTDVDRRR
jgi:hypothetical protein